MATKKKADEAVAVAENPEIEAAKETEEKKAPAKKRTAKKKTEPETAEEKTEEAAKEAPKKESKKATSKDIKVTVKAEEKADDSGDKPARKKRNYLKEFGRAIPKGLSEEDALKEMAARDTFSGETASKAERQALNVSDKVITRTGNEEVETVDTIRRKEYQDLRGAAKATRILEGEIIGVRHSDPDDPTSTIMADVLYGEGTFKISIPSYVLFNYDEEAYADEKGRHDLFNMVKQRITSTIDFVPAYVDERTGTCIGDRLRAMSMIGVDWYLTRRGREEVPRIIKGCLVKGRIAGVGRTYIIVDAMGADVRIPQTELSYLHIGDARTHFTVGSDVVIKILDVKEENVEHGRNQKYRLVKVKGSVKQAMRDKRKEYIKQFEPGTFASATITYIDENLHVFCELNGGQMDCLCGYPRTGPVPAVGQKRTVRIEVKDEDELRLFGRFVNS